LKRQSLVNDRSAPNAVALCGLVASLLALTACPGSLGFDYVPPGGGGGTGGGNDGGIPMSCANAMDLLSTSCASCHASPANPTFASLDLVSPNVAQRLVGVAASGDGQCLGQGNLLNHGTLPATGILIDKINFKVGTCGMGMPFGSQTPLPAADLACLQAWANGLVSSVP
jgi:hypothetical protein